MRSGRSVTWRSLPSSLTLLRAAASLAVAMVGLTSGGARAQAPTFEGAPRAFWIAPPDVLGDSFVVFHARRAFSLPSAPARFVVHVSADNRYRLYVNGALASSGPQRADVAH